MTETTLLAPAWYAAIPFVGFALLAALSVTVPAPRESPDPDGSPSSKVWPALPAIALVFTAIWCLLGNYAGERNQLIIYTIVLTVTGTLSALRDWIRLPISKAGPVGAIVRDACCIAVVVASCLCALEMPWNEVFPALSPTGIAIEAALVLGIQLSLYFLGQRSGGLMGLGVFVACFAGIAQSFLIRFKGVSILPSDLYAMGTAISVGEGYSYAVTMRQLIGVMAGAVGMLAASLPGPHREATRSRTDPAIGRHAMLVSDQPIEAPRSPWRRVLEVVINLLLAAAFAGLVFLGVTRVSFIDQLGVEVDYGHTVDSYSKYGFFTSFVAAWQDFPIKSPDGYTETAARVALEDLAARYESELGGSEGRLKAEEQFAETMPTVIVVMNESFCDLSSFDALHAGYEGPTYFRSIPNALNRGELAVSVIGGGTCNTEFEFLTGNSYAFVGSGKYPYVTYDLSESDSLVRQLADLGYGTHAIHPNDPLNWDRQEVYEALGFDEFHAIDEFEEAPTLHMGATDAATYDKILEILSLDSRPQFIFDVTMQNHGSYNLEDIPEELQVHYEPEGDVSEEDVAQLNEYLSCIQASDADLEAFMGQLSKLDRRVVLVFFGDHQPPFTTLYNDLYFPDEDDLAHQERTHQSNYFIWANYDVLGREQTSAEVPASADSLAAMTLDLIGAPLTQRQQAQLAARLDVSAVNIFGYRGADGEWYAPNSESAYEATYDQIAWINYLSFGSRIRGK